MSKKTFLLVFGLLAVCGVLAMVVFKVASTTREQREKSAAIWTVNVDTSSFQQLVFEADGKTLISVGGGARKWDVATGKLKSKLPRKGNSWLRYSPDGKYYAYGILARDFSQTVNLHDASSNALLQTFVFPKGNEKLYVSMPEVVFSNQGTLLNINYLLRHNRPRGQGFIFTEIFTIWDTRTKKQVRFHSRKVTEREMRDYYQDPFFSPDDRQLLFLETENDTEEYLGISPPLRVHLKDLLSNKRAAIYNIAPDANSILAEKWEFASVSPNGSSIVAVNSGQGTGFSMSGNKSEGTVYAFSPQTQKVLWKHYANGLMTQALAFSPDGKVLAWGGRDEDRLYTPTYTGKGKLLLLDAQTGEVISELTERTWLDSSKEKQISKVEMIRGVFGVKPKASRVPRYLPGDNGTVECLAFSPDGKMLAVGYFGGLIKLWRVPHAEIESKLVN